MTPTNDPPQPGSEQKEQTTHADGDSRAPRTAVIGVISTGRLVALLVVGLGLTVAVPALARAAAPTTGNEGGSIPSGAAGRGGRLGQRRRQSQLRRAHRRGRSPAGRKPVRAGLAASRHLHDRHRRRQPQLRRQHRRDARLLGQQRLRAGSSPPGGTYTTRHRRRQPTAARSNTDGTLACWGNNDFGQALAAGRHLQRPSPAGDSHSCAVNNRRVARLLGPQRRTGRQRPPPPTRSPRSAPAAPTVAPCCTDGSLACWGQNFFGQAAPSRRHLHHPLAPAALHTCAVNTQRDTRLLGPQRLRTGLRRPPAPTLTR